MKGLLARGLGVHHSGVLPILKEVIEMLFQRGLVKMLFATETFAMGVNMPARTVVFDSIRKHDGYGNRDLLPGEYIQMAGRAGRRGLDTTGTVIIMCKGDMPEMSDLHRMMLGTPTKLESRFRLTYSMILNLLRVEQLGVQDMMRRSFGEFSSLRSVDARKKQLHVIKEKLAGVRDVECSICGDLEQYIFTLRQYRHNQKEMQELFVSHPRALKTLSPGRVLVVDYNGCQNMLAIILSCSTSSKQKKFTVLLLAEKNSNNILHSNFLVKQQLHEPSSNTIETLAEVTAEDIRTISTKVLKLDVEAIKNDIVKRQQPRFWKDEPAQSTALARQQILQLFKNHVGGDAPVTMLDPVKDFGIRDIEMQEKFRNFQNVKDDLPMFSCLACSQFSEHYQHASDNIQVREEFQSLKFKLSDDSLQLLPEYNQRIEVLGKCGYVEESKIVRLKGRVACEIHTHELVLSELLFENVFTNMPPEEIAALLSCLVFQQKNFSEPKLSENLEQGYQTICGVVEDIRKIEGECGLRNAVDYFKPNCGLVEVVHEWAKGMPFSDITDLTDVQEGVIVRCIQRLDELLHDVRNAARIVGEPTLQQKMESASNMIKRDIVFAASLYTH